MNDSITQERLAKVTNPDAFLWVLSKWPEYVTALEKKAVLAAFYAKTAYLEDVSDDTITIYNYGFERDCLHRRIQLLNKICREVFGPGYSIALLGIDDTQNKGAKHHGQEQAVCG